MSLSAARARLDTVRPGINVSKPYLQQLDDFFRLKAHSHYAGFSGEFLPLGLQTCRACTLADIRRFCYWDGVAGKCLRVAQSQPASLLQPDPQAPTTSNNGLLLPSIPSRATNPV
eukprot:770197-Rhodomonas_salina.2